MEDKIINLMPNYTDAHVMFFIGLLYDNKVRKDPVPLQQQFVRLSHQPINIVLE